MKIPRTFALSIRIIQLFKNDKEMVLELSKSFVHNTCEDRQRKYTESELQNILLRLMRDNDIDPSAATISGGAIELQGAPGLKLHSMLLQAEELGLAIKYTKKTLIEIC